MHTDSVLRLPESHKVQLLTPYHFIKRNRLSQACSMRASVRKVTTAQRSPGPLSYSVLP